MNSYRLLEHTADMGLSVQADSLPELFRQSAFGLRRIITSCQDIRSVREIDVQLSGEDVGQLLVSWLSELVYLFESQLFLPADIKFEFLDEQFLQARIGGETIDPQMCPLEREIKAVTYHQLLVEETGSGWQARVFVDL